MRNLSPPVPPGYVIVVDEDRRSERLRDRLELWHQQAGLDWASTFSDALSAPDWKFRETAVCFLSLDGESLNYACLARRGPKVATAKYRVTFSNFVDLKDLSLDRVGKRIGKAFRRHLTRAASGRGGRVPAKTWVRLLAAVRRLREGSTGELEDLFRLAAGIGYSVTEPASEIIALERDALGVALDIFDGRKTLRKRALRAWRPSGRAAPFIQGLQEIRLSEEQILSHDCGVFASLPSVATIYGRRFVLGDRTLDAVYANRTALETTLGVDLVYYNALYEAYTLVQYKRMLRGESENGRNPVYRPTSDRRLAAELRRMKTFRKKVPDRWTGEANSFRLDGDGFFLKLCPAAVRLEASPDLLPGIYLPRLFLESLLESATTDGPRGGKRIGYGNVGRAFNNTQFADLVREGWIGTRGVATARITDLVQKSLNAGHAVVLAHEYRVVRAPR